MNDPRPESRIRFLEKQFNTLGANVEELAEDLKQDNKQLFEHVQQGFSQAHAYIQENIETRLDRIEKQLETMATKDELTAMEGRIKNDIAELKESMLDAMKMLFSQKTSE